MQLKYKPNIENNKLVVVKKNDIAVWIQNVSQQYVCKVNS